MGTTTTAAERAYRHTKSAIIRGALAGGEAVSEVAVCDELGLSRTPVHEAFLRLAAEDLLTLESRKGAIVRPMAPNEARDVLRMREAIEAAAARAAIEDGRQAEADRAMDAALHTQEAAVEQALPGTGGTGGSAARAVEEFVCADDAFHGAVVAASHNAIAVHFTGLLRDRQQRLRHQLMRVRPDQLAPALAQHHALASALRSGDADRYAAVLSEHVALHRGIL